MLKPRAKTVKTTKNIIRLKILQILEISNIQLQNIKSMYMNKEKNKLKVCKRNKILETGQISE